jgi:hypothetical protein
MGKITATVLSTLFVVGVSAGAMAQGMSPGSSSSSPPAASSSGGSMSGTSNGTMSGSSSDMSAPSKIATSTQVKSKLEQSGYTSVTGIHKSADGFTATAKKDGKSVHVAIDQQGNIQTR